MDAEQIKNMATIVSMIVGILSLLGFGTIMTMFWKDKHDRKAKEIEENSELRRQAEDQRLATVVKRALDEKLKPVEQELVEIKQDLAKLKTSAQCSNRCDLDDIWDKAEKQGWCSSDDKNKFEATYQAYHNLGQNGVMDSKHEEILKMPEHPPVRRKRTINEKK